MTTDEKQKNWAVVPWEFSQNTPETQLLPLFRYVHMESSNEQVMHIVFGRNWNIIRQVQGLGGLMFPCSGDVSGPGIFSVDAETDEDDDDELVDQDGLEEKRQE